MQIIIHYLAAPSIQLPFLHTWPLVSLTQSHNHTHIHTHPIQRIHSISNYRNGVQARLYYFNSLPCISPPRLSLRCSWPNHNGGSDEICDTIIIYIGYGWFAMCEPCKSFFLVNMDRLGGLCFLNFRLGSTCGVRLIDTPPNLISYRRYSLSPYQGL